MNRDMIITEDVLESIFSQIDPILINPDIPARVPNFGWGDKRELNRFLSNNDDKSYPLIWLLPTNDNHIVNANRVQKQLALVIATRQHGLVKTTKERYDKSFKFVLNPIANYVVEGLNQSRVSRIIEEEWSIGKFANYSDNEKESKIIDMWDAIRIDVNVELNKHKINIIKWQTKQLTA